MKRYLTWAFAASLLIGLFVPAMSAQTPAPVASGPAGRGAARAVLVEQGPRIDGTLADPVWQKAAVLELGDVRSGRPCPQRTAARVLLDRRRLYLAVECAESDTAGLRTRASGRDGAVRQDDSVELFLWADPERPWRRVAVNAAGVIADWAVIRGDVAVSTWNANAEVKTRVQEGKGWIVTLALPLADLDAYVGRDLAWRLNVARNRPAHGSSSGFEASWAVLPVDNFAQPEHFGRLEGVTVKARTDGVTRQRPPAVWPAGPAFLREEIHLADAGPDEAVTNLRLANNRWVDCFDDGTAVRDMFRIEGVTDKGEQEKALAVWKWFRILVSATGSYEWETDEAGRDFLVQDPHKIFTVYGRGQCDSMSWAMVPLWREAGYIAFDSCHTGHTIASFRYRDMDGHYRFHDLDPQDGGYFWDDKFGRIGTWTMPLLRGRVHRHLTAPQYVHDLRRSMRLGETVELLWDNEGHFVPMNTKPAEFRPDAEPLNPKQAGGVHTAIGQETQTLVADLPALATAALYEGSANLACSAPARGRAALHPARKGIPAVAIWRLPSPYVAVDGTVEATLVKGWEEDTCRLSLSRDGGFSWQPIHTKETAGVEKVEIDIGTAALMAGKPNVYTAYDFRLKAELSSDRDESGVGLNDLRVVAYRECNKRTLPNLMPGENCYRLTFDHLAPGKVLEVELGYSVDDQARQVIKRAAASPFYFRVDTGDFSMKWLTNYDTVFNSGRLQMQSLKFRLADAAAVKADASDPAVTEERFRQACPHPSDMNDIRPQRISESDPMQTSGFFPQSRVVLHDKAAMDKLVQTLRTSPTNSEQTIARWVAAEDLGNYPDAIDALLEELPKADIDVTLGICKALAQIHDKRAVGPLLQRWATVPEGAPGTRYIPDALAAIGDPSVVPALVAPLHGLRFDYRFHIADALGKLGGQEAEAALKDLAENDPFPAIRLHAKEMLGRLAQRR